MKRTLKLKCRKCGTKVFSNKFLYSHKNENTAIRIVIKRLINHYIKEHPTERFK